MPKRFQQGDGPPSSLGRHVSWSIGANGLTSAGQSELLKQIGRQLQADYQDILKEPAPARITELLKRLEARDDHAGEEEGL